MRQQPVARVSIGILLASLLAGVPAVAIAGNGLGLGVSARAVAETETNGPEVPGRETTRTYQVVEPWADLLLASSTLRFEARYQPLFYLPGSGFVDPQPTVFHVGQARLSSLLLRGLELYAMDELRAAPLVFSAPADAAENLVQTNDLRAGLTLERGRAFVLEALVEGRRFDAFDTGVGEEDLDGDGVLDPEEDLDEDGERDRSLSLSFVEARTGATVWRTIATVNRVGVTGEVSTRAFDELVRDDYVATRGGLVARRRMRSTLTADLAALALLYQFRSGDTLSGWEGNAAAAWQMTRPMSLAGSGSVRRTVDPFARRVDVADAGLALRREMARGAWAEIGARATRVRALDGGRRATDVDSGVLTAAVSVPVRWGVRTNAGYRFWRGGGALQWRNDHMVYLGLSWE